MLNPLQQAKEALEKALVQKKQMQEIVASLGPALANALKDNTDKLTPLLKEIAENSRTTKEEVLKAISEIKIPKTEMPAMNISMADIKPPVVNVPEVKFPEIPTPQVTVNVPDIKMPPMPEVKLPKIVVPKPEVTVNVPPIKIPKLEWPKENMPIEGWVQLQGVSLNNPLPVQIRDAEGKPVSFNNLGSNSANAAHVVKVSGVLSTVAVVNVDPDGNPMSSTTGLTDAELRAAAIEVMQVSGASWSVAVSTSLEVKQVSGFSDSVFVTGSADSMLAYQARTTNPTAVSDGGDIRPSADDLGRTLTRPIQVRDLMATAFVTITDSSEDTLIAGVASTYLDLIYILAANESGAAVNLAFRTGTGGSTMFELEVPAESTAGVSLPVPIPASEVAQAWTVQNTGSDISNTTVNISALFSKEI